MGTAFRGVLSHGGHQVAVKRALHLNAAAVWSQPLWASALTSSEDVLEWDVPKTDYI